MRSERERLPEEIIIDKSLLLALYCKVSEKSVLDSVLKAQKLGFLTAAPLFNKRKKAFSLEFFRWKYGPMSKGLYDALDDLSELRLIPRSGLLLFAPSKKAKELSADFWNEQIERKKVNAFVARRIRRVLKKYGGLSPIELRNLVYTLRFATVFSSNTRKVLDIPAHEIFTRVLDDSEAKEKIDIDKDWLDTMGVYLSPKNTASLREAIKSKIVNRSPFAA